MLNSTNFLKLIGFPLGTAMANNKSTPQSLIMLPCITCIKLVMKWFMSLQVKRVTKMIDLQAGNLYY